MRGRNSTIKSTSQVLVLGVSLLITTVMEGTPIRTKMYRTFKKLKWIRLGKLKISYKEYAISNVLYRSAIFAVE